MLLRILIARVPLRIVYTQGLIADVLVDELVIDDGSSQQAGLAFRSFFLILIVVRSLSPLFFPFSIFRADHATLAEDVAIPLARNFFRHLEDHLDQRIYRQGARPVKQQPGLAEVFNGALKPRAGVIDAVAERCVQLQAAGSRCPGLPLLARVTAAGHGFGISVLQALGAAHGGPVIFIFGRAQQTDLIVVSVSPAAWPGKLVGASPEHKDIHDLLRHDGYFRALGVGSQIISQRRVLG